MLPEFTVHTQSTACTECTEGSFLSVGSCGTLFAGHVSGYGESPCFSCSWSSTVAILDYGRLFFACVNMAIMRGCA
jgi:hypothetical protein